MLLYVVIHENNSENVDSIQLLIGFPQSITEAILSVNNQGDENKIPKLTH